ncbi:MAG: tetratricopeptide repeat protein [Myxococcota bacterium]|nr:tetratricopeptide repeat protein [Myxococcota bacterium]
MARLGFAALLVFAVGLALYSPNLRHEFALEQLEEAHRLDPDDELALLNLGAAYAGVREWKLAVDCWERVLEINPKNFMARGNLIEVRRSISLDPD